MAGINLPVAYSKVLDKAYTLESLTAPGFKGKYEIVGGMTKTFKVFSQNSVAMADYSVRKSANNAATFGYDYKDAENSEQTVTATQDRYFARSIDAADAKFSRDGSLDAREFMKTQMREQIVPMIDKYNLSVLATAATATVKATTSANAYAEFNKLMVAQTNAKVPKSGRVAFVTATQYAKLKEDPKFTPDSELTAQSRRSGNYGRIDGALVIEVPDDYLPAKFNLVLTHEAAAAAPKHLADYNQGKFKERASGYYVNGRVVHEAFVFDKKKPAILALKNAA